VTAPARLAVGDPPLLGIASYNVHRCIGRDGRCDADRVAKVVHELNVDVIALQEVDSPNRAHGGLDQLLHLASATGLHPIPGPTLLRYHGQYGNALLTRRDVRAVRRIDLKVPGREARGALDVDLEVDGAIIRVLATHLGLRAGERRLQIAILLRALVTHDAPITVLLGDFNHWVPAFRALRALDRHLGRAAVLRTFPAWRPVLALDRIWVRPASALAGVHVHATPLARAASDHLPVRAAVNIRSAMVAHD
jgi:endonuclease/exonuclease/phosphatase family metal-dependent hydrolase